MRIAVSGALGTLGRPLWAELRRRGHDVLGIDREHCAEADFCRADVADYRQLSDAFAEIAPEVVYHLAAEFGRHNGEAFYEDLWRTGAIGTRNVLELCSQAGAQLLFASSSEIYGEVDAGWLDEELDRTPLRQLNEYALSKWANEMQIVNFQRRYGLDATRLRFFNAYGPGELPTPYRSVVALFCHKALLSEPLPVYEGYERTFMFIDDFTPTLANVCEVERLEHGVYNIGGTDYRSVRELAEIVLEAAGAGEINMIAEDLHNVRSKRPDITRARAELGHDPQIRLEQGVPATIDWVRERLDAGRIHN